MAEYGAHITITSRNRPSIFDVVAQDSLLSTLQPALKHALKVLAESNPERYGWCLQSHCEIFAIFNFIIQYHYLSNYGASFAENFYDLKRIQIHKADGLEPLSLSSKTITKSVVALVCFPYIQNKLDNVFNSLRERESDGLLSQKGWISSLQRFFLKLWPVIHLSWEGLCLIFYLRYLVGKSKFHSPLLLMCGVKLANLTDDDLEVIEDRAQAMLSFRNIRSARQLGQWFMERIGSSIMNSLEVTAFFLQFLDWFYSSGNTPRSIASKPIPAPPQITDELKPSSLKSEDCPVCYKKRKQDTALSVSGYVFCYSCILTYVKNEGKCPVTGYPATSSHLIRIYLDA
ncbi:peroxisome assembly protein 12 [Palaemon carinicauda]|uniref:peroxisome assembly protein 12 n=1 Tax=Palaemon carinicauda TaxID=392227 RepID=UPI0035B5F4C4